MNACTAAQLAQRHRSLRYLVPAGVLGVVTLVATGVLTSRASSDSSAAALPRTTPTSLMSAMSTSHTTGFSGTIVSDVDLGLPQLPDLDTGAAGGSTGGGISGAALLAGSHTMQFWYGGPGQQRVALFGATDESDMFHNGRDLWTWDSDDRTASHTILPSTSELIAGRPALAVLTPAMLARLALGSIGRSTVVHVDRPERIAGRSAYVLTLTPRTTATTIGSVYLAIDGATKVPLAVRVYPRGSDRPAIDVSFTSILFGTPSPRNFTFDPPPDATVRTVRPQSLRASASHQLTGSTVFGSGWSAVAELRPSAAALRALRGAAATGAEVSGSWGRGRLLQSSLVDALVTDDGRVYAGAVEPATLYAAAGTR